MATGTETEAESRDPLIKGDTEDTGAVAAGAVGLSAVLFALSLASLFEVVELTTPVAGVPLVTFVGGALVALGGAVIAFGIGSRLGYVETEPQSSAGIVAGLAFALMWFVAAGLVASQTLGLGTVGWGLSATAVAVGVYVL